MKKITRIEPAAATKKKTEGLREILKFTGKHEMLSAFDAELFERFVDHITVCSRQELIFHLTCGLSLTERIER